VSVTILFTSTPVNEQNAISNDTTNISATSITQELCDDCSVNHCRFDETHNSGTHFNRQQTQVTDMTDACNAVTNNN